jgi:hypothetical protein
MVIGARLASNEHDPTRHLDRRMPLSQRRPIVHRNRPAHLLLFRATFLASAKPGLWLLADELIYGSGNHFC